MGNEGRKNKHNYTFLYEKLTIFLKNKVCTVLGFLYSKLLFTKETFSRSPVCCTISRTRRAPPPCSPSLQSEEGPSSPGCNIAHKWKKIKIFILFIFFLPGCHLDVRCAPQEGFVGEQRGQRLRRTELGKTTTTEKHINLYVK